MCFGIYLSIFQRNLPSLSSGCLSYSKHAAKISSSTCVPISEIHGFSSKRIWNIIVSQIFTKTEKGPMRLCVSLCFIFIVGTNVWGSHNAWCDRLHSLGHETSPLGKLDQHRTLPGNSLSLVVNNNQFYPCNSTFKAHFPISPYSPSVNQASILIRSFELHIFEYWWDYMCPP